MNKPRRIMTDREVEKALKGREAGMTLEELARAYRVSVSQIFTKTEALRTKRRIVAARERQESRSAVPVTVEPREARTSVSDLCRPISGKATASFHSWGSAPMGNIERG